MRINTNTANFSRLYGQGNLYVDKTSFLKKWWEAPSNVTLITRPRRFGKTLTMSMIEYFFSPLYKDMKKEDGTALFDGLEGWNDPKMRLLHGAIPVISMSLSGMKEGTKEEMEKTLSAQVSSQCNTYWLALSKSSLLNAELLKELREYGIANSLPNPATAYLRLCQYLQLAFGEAPILLLDEYDTPLTEAFLRGTLSEVIAPLRSFFVQCYKDNKFFSKCLITGITRIAQQSLFSDFNNPDIDTMLESNYPALMGYTEEEVLSLLKQAGLEDRLQEVKKMYDGYSIAGTTDIYNPYSVNKYLAGQSPQNYWIGSSQSSLPKKIMTEGNTNIRHSIIQLINGEGVWTEIPTDLIYETLFTQEAAALSLLFFSGYLKAVDKKMVDGDILYEVMIPNQEVLSYYKKILKEEKKHTRNQSSPSLIQEQPKDATGKKGEIIPLTVKGSKEGLSYQWMSREEGEDTWKKSRIAGSKTSVLLVTGSPANAKKRFKCLLSQPRGSAEETQEVRILLS